jgi:hypothetical protein
MNNDCKLDMIKDSVIICFTDCRDVNRLMALNLYPLTCNLDNTCTGVTCCIDSLVINSTFEVMMKIDPCNRVLLMKIENLKAEIPFKDVKWGNNRAKCRIIGSFLIDNSINTASLLILQI